MSEVLTKIKTRRSIRKFKSDMVSKEILDQIIEAGLWAASGRNSQTPIILCVTNKELRDKLSKANAQVMGSNADPFYGAPVVLVVLAKKSWPTYLYDGSLVMGNLMLAAHELGVGSCWIHRAKEVFEMAEWKEWLQTLGIEEEYEGIGNCVLGYADGEYPKQVERKDGRVFYIEDDLSQETMVATGRVVKVDYVNRNFTMNSEGDFSGIIQFNIPEGARIFDPFGRPMPLTRLSKKMRVIVTHANFMTASIPPQTTAYEVKVPW